MPVLRTGCNSLLTLTHHYTVKITTEINPYTHKFNLSPEAETWAGLAETNSRYDMLIDYLVEIAENREKDGESPLTDDEISDIIENDDCLHDMITTIWDKIEECPMWEDYIPSSEAYRFVADFCDDGLSIEQVGDIVRSVQEYSNLYKALAALKVETEEELAKAVQAYDIAENGHVIVILNDPVED